MNRFLQASFFASCFIELSFGFSLQKNNVSKPNLDKAILQQPARENSTIDLQNWGLVNTDQSNSGRPESDLQIWGLVDTDQSNSSRTESDLQNWGLMNTHRSNSSRTVSNLQNSALVNTDQSNSSRTESDIQNWGLVNMYLSNSGRPKSDLQIWGLVDVSTDQSNSVQLDLVQTNTNPNIVQASTNAPVATQEPSSCQPYVVKRPDFRKSGRRISEAKCYEYIWEMKNREDEEMHKAQCSQYRVIRSLTQKATFTGKRRDIIYKYKGTPYVVGGGPVDSVEFPHMGALGWKAIDGVYQIFKCGCTLISSKFVVTAAHCSRASPNDVTIANVIPEIVKLGDESLPAYYRIARIIVHPLYESPMRSFDIALVELAEPINYFSNYIQPACLWHDYDTSSLGSHAIVTGWGYTDLVRKTMATQLQTAVLDIIDQNQCDQLLGTFRLFDGLQSHQLCAGKLAGGVDACQGDSGGPLQVKIAVPSVKQGKIYYLIGVTSFGRGCGNPDSPGVYTRISSFVDWIESIVWAE